jgi:hypothetical protein
MFVFAVVIFLATASPFFFILWNKSGVLYPPREFGSGTEIDMFAEILHSGGNSSTQHSKNIEQAVRDALTNPATTRELATALVSVSPRDQQSLQVDHVIEKSLSAAADIAVKRIREASLMTFFPQGVTNGGIQFSIEPHTIVTLFLWVSTASLVDDSKVREDPWTFEDTQTSADRRAQLVFDYGKKWVWRDRRSGKICDEIGPQWGLKNGIGVNDTRTLDEVGMKPGMEFEYVSMDRQWAQTPLGGEKPSGL